MRERAIVIGASLAGMCTAAVLAHHFDEVRILERDALCASGPRKGVPQGHHVHNLLARGDEVLASLFPGLFVRLEARGAVRVDWSRDVRWHHHGVWKARAPSGVESWLMSRPVLDACVRAELTQMPGVSIDDGVSVDGLWFAEPGRVGGVVVQGQRVEGELVVDCAGRGSPVPRWLTAAGWPSPPVSEIRSDVVYATRPVRLPREPDFAVLAQIAPPPGKRSAVAFAIEDGQWMVTLFGYHGEHPPADEAGWHDFARSLHVPDVAQLLDGAEPLGDIVRYRFPATRWRRIERETRRPRGLLSLGDSVCSFNPIYGQGMTSAALQAEALRDALDGFTDTEGLDRRLAPLPRRLATIVHECWAAVASEDFRHAETTGDRLPLAGVLNWYTRQLHRRAGSDAEIGRRFLRVMHMQASVGSLLGPRTLLRVLGSRA